MVLALQSGGSVTFKYLVAMRNTGNAFVQQDSILLGDRIRTSAMTIAGGQTHIEMLAAGPEDPACCPSQKLKLSYVLSKGKWLKSVLVSAGQSDVASHSQTDITGRA